MRQIREVLRLKFAGLPHRAIARALGLSAGSVAEYASRATRAGLSWPLPDGLDDARLEEQLYPRPAGRSGERPEPEFPEVHQELRRKGVTLQLLWHEYIESHPDGYGYSRYCELYQRWRGKLSIAMRQVHRPGEKAFVDFSGLRPVLSDPRTGEKRKVELFVGVLGASSYTYAEAVEDQKLASWLRTHERMFAFFEGVPAVTVPDSLKSAVTRASRYEPEINRSFQELAEHYGTVVIPARPRHPKDKAKVEAAVLLAERWILATLRNRVFFSLAELNAAIRQQLRRLNERPMRQLGASRRELFEKLDRPALRPLPENRFEPREWKKCQANIDYHVEVEGSFYSVPHALHGVALEARYTASTVEVFHRNTRVASHPRLHRRGSYSTTSQHMPAAHRAHAEWTPSRLIHWAGKIGEATGRVVAEILRLRPHPEQGYRSCLGLMRLGKVHGEERLEAACLRAEKLGSFRYQTVKNILASGQDRLPFEEETSAPRRSHHPHVRGAAFYADEKETRC